MRFFLLFLVFVLSGSELTAQTAKPVPPLKFTKRSIAAENFESVEIFDVDNDTIVDIVSGGFWYKGPTYARKIVVQDVKRYGEYYDNFSTIPLDVNSDGKMDFVTCGWWGQTLRWMQNPGKDTLWTEHVIARTGNIETTRAWDVDGDGLVELVPNTPGQPLFFYKQIKNLTFISVKVIDKHEHGLGFGDINKDGRGDFIISEGWIEAPVSPLKDPWVFHPEFNLGLASVPIIVTDVNKDGLNDLIVGQGHDYGLFWYEQKLDKKKRFWIKHIIDPYNSQFHTMQWVDIDNDGEEELVTGKRYRAHNENDPGALDPVGLYYFKWNGESFTKQVISFGIAGEGKGTGIYFSITDLDKNNWKDIIVAGKDGLFVFYNQGR